MVSLGRGCERGLGEQGTAGGIMRWRGEGSRSGGGLKREEGCIVYVSFQDHDRRCSKN